MGQKYYFFFYYFGRWRQTSHFSEKNKTRKQKKKKIGRQALRKKRKIENKEHYISTTPINYCIHRKEG